MVGSRIELLTLRRRNRIDDIIKSVPIPKRAVPKNALPGWKELPLYQKLPMLNCPTNQIVFSRQKLGNKLHKTQNAGFMLHDPNSHDVSYQYVLLHDHHLKAFYKQKLNNQRTKDIGRVTKSNEALCTLREFNEYRLFCNRIHNDAVNLEIKRLNELDEDRRRFRNAEEIAKDVEKGPRQLELQKLREKQFIEKEICRNHLKELITVKHQESLKRAKKIKELKKNKLIAASNELDAKIAEKQKQKLNNEKDRIIKLKKYWRERECKRIAHEEKKLLKTVETQLKEDMMRWENKMDYRLIRQYKNEILLRRAENQTRRNVEKRKKQIKKIIERTEHIKSLKKVAFLRSHYENRSLDNLIKVFYDRLKIYATKINNAKEKRLKELLENPDQITDEKELAELEKLKEYSRGMYKTIEVYETPKISAAGLNEPLCGYLTLTYQNVRDAITSAVNTSKGFKIPNISTMDVYNNTKIILDRIANKDVFELPTDEFIMNFVLRKLWTLMKTSEDTLINSIKSLLKNREAEIAIMNEPPNKSTICYKKPKPKVKLNKTKHNVSFGVAEIIEYSYVCNPSCLKSSKKSSKSDSEIVTSNKDCKKCPNTRIPNLKLIADAVLSTEGDEDKMVISDEMKNDQTLTHVTRPQKLCIQSNLQRFSQYYTSQLEMLVMPCLNLFKYKIIKPNWINDVDPNAEEDFITEMSTIIVTFPENDQNFAKIVIMLSKITAQRLIDNISDYVKNKVHKSDLLYVHTIRNR